MFTSSDFLQHFITSGAITDRGVEYDTPFTIDQVPIEVPLSHELSYQLAQGELRVHRALKRAIVLNFSRANTFQNRSSELNI